jgi:hypothetical protein
VERDAEKSKENRRDEVGVDVDRFIMDISKARERFAKRIGNSPITREDVLIIPLPGR